MRLSKSEFCQFSLAGKMQLLDEFGEILFRKTYSGRTLIIFGIYGFYVLVVYRHHRPENAEPVSSRLVNMLIESGLK
jgi:hypothetical protein